MSGYTDEALEEGHDLIAHAEEEAHLAPDGINQLPTDSSSSKSKKSMGLESSGSKSESSSKKSTGESMKSKMGEKMDSLKESMNMK